MISSVSAPLPRQARRAAGAQVPRGASGYQRLYQKAHLSRGLWTQYPSAWRPWLASHPPASPPSASRLAAPGTLSPRAPSGIVHKTLSHQPLLRVASRAASDRRQCRQVGATGSGALGGFGSSDPVPGDEGSRQQQQQQHQRPAMEEGGALSDSPPSDGGAIGGVEAADVSSAASVSPAGSWLAALRNRAAALLSLLRIPPDTSPVPWGLGKVGQVLALCFIAQTTLGNLALPCGLSAAGALGDALGISLEASRLTALIHLGLDLAQLVATLAILAQVRCSLALACHCYCMCSVQRQASECHIAGNAAGSRIYALRLLW